MSMSLPGRSEVLKPRFSALIAAAMGFLFLACAVSSPVAAQNGGKSGSVYVDPQQRFTIRVPPGWVARPFNSDAASGVTIAHGESAYVQIFLQKGIDPGGFLKALNSGLETSHPGYRISDRGVRTVNGTSRMFIVGEAAETSSAPRTRMYLETFAANEISFAIIASTSAKNGASKELMADFNVSQDIIGSFTMGVPASSAKAAASTAPAAPSKAPPAKTPAPPAKTPAVPPAAPSVAAAAPSPPAVVAAPAAAVAPAPPAPVKTESVSAANGAPSPELSPEDQRKLSALAAAWKGGVLSEAEYNDKKSALYAGALQQAENAARLKALDQALQDGVLTREEYERKKKDLSAEAAPAAPPVPSATEMVPQPEAPALQPTEAVTVKTEPKPEAAPKNWTTVNDPAGFVVSLPPGWTMGRVRATGQVVIRGTRGEELLVWPLRLKQPVLDARGAAALLQELARKFNVLMPWGTVQSLQSAARVTGQGAQRTAAGILRWANNPGGASIYFYGVEAPSDVYGNSVDVFAGVLRSFGVVQDPGLKNLAGGLGGAPTALNFTTWSDPHEGAFHVSVPVGWHVVGGTYRLSAEDVRYGVVMDSPDGQVRASIGDAMVGAFTQPSQALAATGLKEGAYQTLADGTRVEILRYLSGQQFARSYVETLVSRQCTSPQISFNNDREDLAAFFSQSAAKLGFIDSLLTAGDVSFSCTLDGRPVKGKYVTATIRMSPNVSPMWLVYRLYGYVAFSGREQDGENVLEEMIASWKFTPEWEALQKTVTNPAVPPDNARAEEIRERAQADIAEDQKQISDMTAKDAEQRQKSFDQIDSKRATAVLGTLDVVDRETGTPYKLNEFSDYHYLSNDAQIGAGGSARPGSSARELIAVP